MKQSSKIFIPLAVAAMMFAVAGSENAKAGSFKLFGSKIELAYAPQALMQDDRFNQFDESEEELHEMNDAWLGMPVHSADGKLAGFVEDAYLDVNGDVSELLVSLTDRNYAVYVDSKYAELTDINVSVSLSDAALANLERENGFVVTSR